MKTRKKAYTVKDTIAAMQYGKERLVKAVRHHASSKPVEFHLSPSGVEIGPRIAESAINSGQLAQINDGLFDGLSQQFFWSGGSE